MQTPPHLPSKSCSVPLYRRLMMSSSLIVITLIALVSGLVGGIVSDVYIVPEQGIGTDTGVISRGPAHVITDLQDPVFLRDQLRRSVTLVQKDVYDATGYIPLNNTYEAVLLTDTGWFVMPKQRDMVFRPEEWIAVSMNGETYEIDSFQKDPAYDLLYGSLNGNGFRVTAFAPVSSLEPSTSLWAMHHGVIERTALAYPTPVSVGVSTPLGGSQYVFQLQDQTVPRSILWTDDGAFFGFVNEEGVIVPWFVVESIYTDVFTGSGIVHDTAPVTGHMVRLTEKQSARVDGAKYGFFVDTVLEKGVVVAEDLITHVGDSAIEPWTMQALVAKQTGESISVRVLRNGERHDVSILKN